MLILWSVFRFKTVWIFNDAKFYSYMNLNQSFTAYIECWHRERKGWKWELARLGNCGSRGALDDNSPPRTDNFSVRRTAMENWGTIFTRGTSSPSGTNASTMHSRRFAPIQGAPGRCSLARRYRQGISSRQFAFFFYIKWNITFVEHAEI